MDPQPLPRQRALTAIEGALALIAVLLVVQMWLLTATLESVLAGHPDAAVPAAVLSTLLFGACAALYGFVARIDADVRKPAVTPRGPDRTPSSPSPSPSPDPG
jgi:hypothetical protein